MSKQRAVIDWRATMSAAFIAVALLVFPFANPCETEDGTACTWNADAQGNGTGHSFTNFYGVNIYHPWSFIE